MSLNSMTGFGRGHGSAEGVTARVDIKSVNHRYLELRFRLPGALMDLEDKLDSRVRKRLNRGKVDLQVHLGFSAEPLTQIRLNSAQLRALMHQAGPLAEQLGCAPPSLGELLSLPSVVEQVDREDASKAVSKALFQALDQALDELTSARAKEGDSLVKDLNQRLQRFAGLIDQVETLLPEVRTQLKERLRSRIQDLIEEVAVDEQRLAMEVAVLLEKADIQEELVRLKHHMESFTSVLAGNGNQGVGKKLDFICQEVLRETNTLMSKLRNVQVTPIGVEMKELLEQIREQVQNVE